MRNMLALWVWLGKEMRTDGVFVAESELEAVGLVLVEWVLVQDLDVHLPLFQVFTFHHRDPRG